KQTYLASQFRRLAARRGGKRAIVAVGHSLLIIGYYLQKNEVVYEDLGGDYFDRLNADGLRRYLVKRLESMGHKVTLEPAGLVQEESVIGWSQVKTCHSFLSEICPCIATGPCQGRAERAEGQP